MKKFAFVFPGQGSQSVGMLNGWGDHPAVQQVLAQASEALSQDIGKLIREGTKEELALTTNTQPVMLVAAVAAYRVWIAEGGERPSVLAGHSLGEYSALVAADALTLSDAALLVRFRAEAMQRAVPVGYGAMAAILGLPRAAIEAVCQQVSQSLQASEHGTARAERVETVEAANFNDPLQTVISGSKAAVDQACEALKLAGAKRAILLAVSAPFHSSLMHPAAEALREKLANVAMQAPQIAVINNVDVASVADVPKIKEALYRQAFGPVRWVETVQTMSSQGIEAIVECGPGKVLAGMCKRIDAALSVDACYDLPSLLACRQLLQ